MGMGKRSLLLVLAILVWGLGFSQQLTEKQVKIYIGSLKCEKQVEISRIQLLNEGRFTFVVNDTDTIKSVSYSMQMLKADYLTEKTISRGPIFTPTMKNYIKYNKKETKSTKIWVENITIKYKEEEPLELPAFTILIKD
jgi:uncharacterized protein YlaI